jgi:hypothetical protein
MCASDYYYCFQAGVPIHLDEVLFRTSVVLKHYRAFELPPDSKFRAWLDRLFAHPSVKATCSTEQLYLDSYER